MGRYEQGCKAPSMVHDYSYPTYKPPRSTTEPASSMLRYDFYVQPGTL